MPTLSILICTLESRKESYRRLIEGLCAQAGTDVEILSESDHGDISIGEKRQRLLEQATGDWACFHDDDDPLQDGYVHWLLEALKCNPDAVGFKVKRWRDGYDDGYAVHTVRNPSFAKRILNGKPLHLRPINHLNPVRRELALQVGFKPWDKGEDRDYATRLAPLIESEVFIDRVLYEYRWVQDKESEKRHG